MVKYFGKLSQVLFRMHFMRSMVANPNDYTIKAHSSCKSMVQRSRTLCSVYNHHQQQKQRHQKQSERNSTYTHPGLVFTAAFSFNLFGGGDKEEETPETKLVNTIKRSIICIQKQQYDKAEQMLHLALRMAQDIQSANGITYVYDVMANLAMEREQFKKAEALFVDVMKRLMAEGYTEDNVKILHISAKIAHMSQLQGDLVKSFQGFTWTLQRLAKLVKELPENSDVLELYGLTKNWFGQLLMKQGKYEEAKNLFKEALDILIDVYGTLNDASVTILNNISVAYVNLEKYAEAKETLLRALQIAKELKDSAQEGVIQANLGLVYLREGLLSEAEKLCKLAWNIGQRNSNADAIEQAEYCLNEIKSTTKV
ncbi:tetratricopeptide repeat protein 19 homolog, mitochondrial isoform X1 [Drosophila hydei]|uniref:Tetratricopeptide repeat protein 19 homolog, mitochondrial isoform X1 n=1 Tax=Drosophila hydei TaxID=7224 RepID=A0A6J1LX99_DROHY|nr:tetratricopeptide repeat protein 19 homolog, mitochondrial isoform X1 [Drosophila hydei]